MGKSVVSVDKEIGGMVRALREERGLTQSDLANALGIRYQQVQKYETGANRISAAALQVIADRLRVHPACFFRLAQQGLAAGFAEDGQAAFEEATPRERIERALLRLEEAGQLPLIASTLEALAGRLDTPAALDAPKRRRPRRATA